MDLISKRRAMEILDYWKFIELLGQKDTVKESSANMKLVSDILAGKRTKKHKVEIFKKLDNPEIDISKLLEDDDTKYGNYSVKGDSILFCFGSINRNLLVRYLFDYMGSGDEYVTGRDVYEKDSEISWFSFRVDMNGTYIGGSFRLSPILWVISEWSNSSAQNISYRLNKSSYDSMLRQFEYKLDGRTVTEFLGELYKDIEKAYIREDFKNDKNDKIGFCVYTRYKKEEQKASDTEAIETSDIISGTFLKEITLFADAFAEGIFNDRNLYGKQVFEYILSAYQDTHETKPFSPRIQLSPNEERKDLRKFFELSLDIKRTPMSKAPDTAELHFMDQVAVNLITDESWNTPLFTVNVSNTVDKNAIIDAVMANNIVRTAENLAAYIKPDDAFEENGRYLNDKINNYGIVIVTDNSKLGENVFHSVDELKEYIADVIAPLYEGDVPDYDIARSEFMAQMKKVRSLRGELETLCKSFKAFPDMSLSKIADSLTTMNRAKADVEATDKEISDLEVEISGLADNKKKIPIFGRKAQATKEALISERQRRLEALKVEREEKFQKYQSLKNCKAGLEIAGKYEGTMTFMDHEFLDKFITADDECSTPWVTFDYNLEREKLCEYAKRFIVSFALSSEMVKKSILSEDESFGIYDFQKVFLFLPVITTTLDSSVTLFGNIKTHSVIGQLFIDEANKIQPSKILGLLFRSRKALIMGAVKGSLPTNTPEADVIKRVLLSDNINCYKPRKITAKFCSDYVNPYGVYIGKGNEKVWTGLPVDLSE